MPFNYTSIQVHSEGENGSETTTKNTIKIHNNKGVKRIEKYSNGKLLKKADKKLSEEEILNISKRKFMPGLFNDCISRNCRKTRKNMNTLSNMSKIHKTRTKRIAHKRH
jgi:hypothetical protein